MTPVSGESAQLLILLHAHLPFVRHPEHPEFFEETWYFEAVLECYLPLLEVLDGWARDGVPAALTLSVSPTLAAMWQDDMLGIRLRRYLTRLQDFAAQEEIRAHFLPERRKVATFYRYRLDRLEKRLEGIGANLPAAFGSHARAGRLELITCPATHPTLPLLLAEPGAIRTQLLTALESHADAFGAPPAGLWLPECAWESGLESHLIQAGIRWTTLETHGVLEGTPRPRHALFAPVRTPGGLAIFGRDPRSARQVWSRHGGYPGDPRYREFHSDVGLEADWDYVRPHLHGADQRGFTGLKFHRVTGPGGAKGLYDRVEAMEAVREHAAHFVAQRRRILETATRHMDPAPVLMAPYDAELFGHWWFEGPEFLDAVARLIAEGPGTLTLSTPSRTLSGREDLETVQPAASTWGEGGHFGVWLDRSNAWMEVPLRRAGFRLGALAERMAGRPQSAVNERRLNQATRELLLAQASDWPFLLKMGTAGTYPERRFREHVRAVHELADQIEHADADVPDPRLLLLEARHNLFPKINWRRLIPYRT